jgi:hypothetical protein
MNEYFPAAEINPSSADFARLAGLAFPDPDDRHVFAGALAAEADAICTNNTKDFPVAVASSLGLKTLQLELLSVAGHRMVTRSMNGGAVHSKPTRKVGFRVAGRTSRRIARISP